MKLSKSEKAQFLASLTPMLSINESAPDVTNTSWDHIVVSVSGGKDSSVLLAWAVRHFPLHKLIAVHALIDLDWEETKEINRAQCKHFGVPLVEVQAVDSKGKSKGFLDILTRGKTKRDGTKEEQKFPDMANRWCTSDLKRCPIHNYVRTLKGNILVLIGERREESEQRSMLNATRPHTGLSKNGRNVVEHSPLLDMSEATVWNTIKELEIPVHPVYSWGVSRASCAICIFSSNKEIVIASQKAPQIVKRYLEAEKKISHTFRYRPSSKARPAERITVADILRMEGVDVNALMS